MIKSLLKLSSMSLVLFGCALATEFRSPLAIERGALRNDMEKKEEKRTLKTWSAGYSRTANKAFLKHGSKTEHLSALLFNADNFKVSEALAAGLTTDFSQEFNANLNSTRLYPRVSYTEQGVLLGAAWDKPVYGKKGRLGVRGSVPFKTIRMERDNTAETNEAGEQTNYILNDLKPGVVIPTDGGIGGAVNTKTVDIPANLYRVSFIQTLPFTRNGNVDTYIGKDSASNNISAGGFLYSLPVMPNFGDNGVGALQAPYVLAYFPHNRELPLIANRAIKLENPLRCQFSGGNQQVVIGANDNNNSIREKIMDTGRTVPATQVGGLGSFAGGTRATTDLTVAPLKALPRDAAQLKEGELYVFQNNTSPAQLKQYQDLLEAKGDDLWLMTVAANNGTLLSPGADADLQSRIQRYGRETAEQWLWRNNYAFNTNQRTGLGDIDLDVFYEHCFNDAWSGEVMLGLRLPTAGSRSFDGNPYKVQLGNGNHVEAKLAGSMGWHAFSWMNVSARAEVAYAMQATEQIAAPFKGATIKNLGPTVDAKIDYARAGVSLDATLYHPKMKSLATTIGYELAYKGKDNVSLKQNTYTFKTLADDANSWFGGFYDNTARAFVSKTVDLDKAVAEKNTDRIAHTFRVETSWQATQYLNLFIGGTAMPFGKNIMQASDMYAGMNINF